MEERRSFFRVDQDVSFDYKSVDTYTVDSDTAESQFSDAPSLGLFTRFRSIDAEANQWLHSIAEKDRHVADYLGAINKKVELLAQQLMGMQAGNSSKQTRQINLSEGGIAFLSDKALYKGGFVAIRLIFVPHYTAVSIYAKVIRCEPGKKGHQVAAKFHGISEAQRQIISKQIMQAQLQAKRQTQSKEEAS